MEFKDTDSDAEHELKLQILRIYLKRGVVVAGLEEVIYTLLIQFQAYMPLSSYGLMRGNDRKDFILDRNLLYPDPFEKDLSHEEREICQRFRVFMRFHSKEEHVELLKTLIEEHRIQTRIQDQEALAAGCHTSVEAQRYIEHKKKREAEENARKAKDSSQTGPSGKFLQRASHLKGELDNSPRGGVIGAGLDDWNINGLPGADLLSEAEKRLCCEIRILPAHYLKMLESTSIEVMKGRISQKSDAHGLFNVDPNKMDRVYDMLVRKGIIQP